MFAHVPLPACACGGTITLTEDRVRDEYCVTHTGPQGTGTFTVAAHRLAAIAPADLPAVVQDIADTLCRGSARPPATGGVVQPGQQYLVGEPSPEMYTLPGDATPRYNRQALEARARDHAPRLVFGDCPCGGLVHWERDTPAARSTFVHLDTRAEIRHGQITDQALARARLTPDQLRCPVVFLDEILGPLAPAQAAPRFACAIEYPDGARAATVVAAADRARVEAALVAAGVRFTLTPEGA